MLTLSQLKKECSCISCLVNARKKTDYNQKLLAKKVFGVRKQIQQLKKFVACNPESLSGKHISEVVKELEQLLNNSIGGEI